MRCQYVTFMLSFVCVIGAGTIASGQITRARDTRQDSASAAQPAVSTNEARARELYNLRPLAFEPRDVRTTEPSGFVARGRGYGIVLTAGEVNLRLDRRAGQASIDRVRPIAIRMRLAGASRSSAGEALDPLPSRRHYLLGNDPSAWRRNVQTYGRVRYRNAYRGIDVVHYGNQGQLEFDFVVSPGGDASNVRLAFDGVDAMDIDPAGDLVLSAGGSSLHVRKPVVYQEIEGRRRLIAGAYVKNGPRQVRFRVATYDATRPLVIDPVIEYATYLGGGGDDGATAVAVDASGHAYLTGWTSSSDFPEGAVASDIPGIGAPAAGLRGRDVFVSKIDPSKTGAASLVYVTVLGGSDDEAGRGIALKTEADGSISAYVAGETLSSNFPTTAFSYQPVNVFNRSTGFVFKLDSSGSILQYSTYLGAYDGSDAGQAIVVDAAGAAYVMGITSASGFPSKPYPAPSPPPATWYNHDQWLALWPTWYPGGKPNPACRHAQPFLAKLDPTGAQIEAWTFLPGCGTSVNLSQRTLARNAASVWVTFNYDDRLLAALGKNKVAVVRFDPSLNLPALVTVQPSPEGDVTAGIDVNQAGAVFVTGVGAGGGGGTPWLMKLNLGAGSYVVSGPVLASQVRPFAVKADAAGNAYVAWGFNFAESGHLLAKYEPAGALVSSILLNGIRALDVDAFESVYAAGVTVDDSSVFLPSAAVQANAFDQTCGTSPGQCAAAIGDAFLVRVTGNRVRSATGAGDVTFATSAGTLDSLAAVAEADLPGAGKPAGVTFPFGFFAWTVTNLTAGQSITVTMTYPTPVAIGAAYWKVIGGNWMDVTSLLSSDDGDEVLAITIVDGGLGDADGLTNGQISDPGAVGVSSASPNPPSAGRIVGAGHVDANDRRHHFEFRASERNTGEDRASLRYEVNARPRDGAAAGRFVSTAILEVAFSDDAAFQPGRRSRPIADTVEFAGTGRWNGVAGYSFRARASDVGEPGRGRDTFTLTISDPNGATIASVSGVLSGGNIQSQ